MKTRKLALLIVLLLMVSLSFADDKISIDDIYGIWINSDYNGNYPPRAKEIHHPEDTSEWYYRVTDSEPGYTFKYTRTDSWHDNEGNLWIKYTWYCNEDSTSGYMIIKLSDSGKTRESVYSEVKYPDEMSPIGGNYAIHYRQE